MVKNKAVVLYVSMVDTFSCVGVQNRNHPNILALPDPNRDLDVPCSDLMVEAARACRPPIGSADWPSLAILSPYRLLQACKEQKKWLARRTCETMDSKNKPVNPTSK